MKDKMKIKKEKILRRRRRVRAKIKGTAEYPRLSVFRSNRHIYGQLIDDQKQITLISTSDLEIKKALASTGKGRRAENHKKIYLAKEVGKLLAKKALGAKIKKAVLDRGSYKFHGQVKQLAEGAREGGLEF